MPGPSPYVSGYRHDVFVSYAHVDNLSQVGVDGWVDTLMDNFKAQLSVQLGRKEREQYREAIEGPARLYGGELDPDQLPVLQHALMRMWTRDAGRPQWERRLTLADYQTKEISGLKNALSKHCDEVLHDLSKNQRHLAEVLFRALSERSGSDPDTRRPTTLGRIADLAEVDPEAIMPVVEAFRHPDRSFLTPPLPEELKPETVLDISHESLISHWETLDGSVRAEAKSADQYIRLLDAVRHRADPTAGSSGRCSCAR